MTAEVMLTRLQANYQILEAQFQKTDLSAIPPAKLVELMLRHALAIQRALQMQAKPSDPPPAPKPTKDTPADPAPVAKPTKAAEPSAPPASAESKVQNPSPSRTADTKSKTALPIADSTQEILDRLRERSESLAAEAARRTGILPPAPASKEPPYYPFRYKTGAPSRNPSG